MAEKVVAVRLEAKTTGFVAGMNKAKASLDDLTKADVPKKAKAFDSLANKGALAGAAIATGIGVAIKKFADFDQAMSAVKANSGATGKEFDNLRQLAMDLGSQTIFSASEAADGINELAKAGVKTSDIMGGGLAGALDLAAAGQVEVGFAAETAATAMTQFGLEGSKVPHIADLLTNAANKAQGGVSDMAMALKQSGLVASATGLSIEETTAGLTAFASAGLIGSDAGTSFKTMLQRLTPQSDAAAKAMKTVGLDAYDAQGNFIGLEAVAGQLKTGMANLSQEQRNAAMTTIFGADAVRAANVLFDQGAEGIAKWTKEVGESGAAAKQAATLTDNLKGDLEQLGGALDTVFIQTGSQANGSLRTLVQGITGFVEALGRVPAPLLLGGSALTAFALLAPKGILKYREYKATLDSLGMSLDTVAKRAPRAAAGLRAVGAAGAAIAGLSIVGAGMEGMWLDVAKGNDEAAKSLDAYIQKGKDAEGVSLSMKIGFGNLGAAVEHAFGTENRNYVMGFFDEVGTGFGIFGADKLTEATQFFSQVDEGLASLVQSGNAEAAKKVFAQIAQEAQKQGVNIDGVKAKLPQYAAALDVAGAAAQNASGPTSTLATATDEIQQSAEEAKKALDELKDAILGLGDPIAQQRAANRDYEASIDNMTQSLKDERDALIEGRLKKLGITDATKAQTEAAGKWADAQLKTIDRLDAGTEAGRKNQANLDAIHASTLEKVAADFAAIQSTKGTEAATKAATTAMQKGRDEFIKAAIAAGKTKGEAEALADQLKLIPSQVPILVEQHGAQAAAAQIDYAARDRHSSIFVTERINRVISQTDMGSDRINRNSPRRATGGAIFGPGTATSDSIPALLSNGEHVWTAAEVNKLGGQSAMYALRSMIRSGWKPQGFAAGGAAVAASAYRAASPSMTVAPAVSGPSLAGVELMGTLDTPWGPATVRGIVRDELSATAANAARLRRQNLGLAAGRN